LVPIQEVQKSVNYSASKRSSKRFIVYSVAQKALTLFS